jgi:hypothetical protein
LSARIVAVLPHDVAVATLVASGALSELAARHTIVYLASPSAAAALPSGAEVVEPRTLSSRRGRALDWHLWNLSLFAYYRQHRLPASTSLKGATLPPRLRRIYRALSHPLFNQAFSFLDRKLLFPHDPAITEFLRRNGAHLVLAPASAMDTYSHLALRSAAHLGIPSAMVVSHWDYFSKKGLLRVQPDRIYVWGDDMRRSAIDGSRLDPRRIEVLGAPQFEKYLRADPNRRARARSRLGVSPSTRLVLFPGTSAPFDELAVLALLDREITGNASLHQVRLLYRPHPRAWARAVATDVDPRALDNVDVDDPAGPGASSDEHYMDLMAAIDAVVSPFSTMTLEAALCGKPSLCTGFADDVNSWNFREATNSDHIRGVQGKRWLTICSERSSLPGAFREFIAGLDEPRLAERIRAEVRSTVFYNDRSYTMRLAERLQLDFGNVLGSRG